MSKSSELAALELVEAKQQLHLLNARFCRAFDRMDRCLMASLWANDATVDCGQYQGDAKAFVVGVTSPDDNLERTFSSISNEYFEIDGDSAIGEVYVINVSTVLKDGHKEDRLIGGRYLDRYKKESSEWKFSERTFVHDWNMNHPTTAVWDEGLFGLFKLRGTRGNADPVYELFGG